VVTVRLPRASRARAILGAAGAGLALASCGAAGSTTTTTVRYDVVLVSDGAGTAPEPVAAPVLDRATSRDDLLGEVRVSPRDVTPDPMDPHRLVVTVDVAAPCRGARITIDEGPATIRILAFVGTVPDAAALACPTAQPQQYTAHLAWPIGTRELIWDQPGP
jgi:hypothetical protein